MRLSPLRRALRLGTTRSAVAFTLLSGAAMADPGEAPAAPPRPSPEPPRPSPSPPPSAPSFVVSSRLARAAVAAALRAAQHPESLSRIDGFRSRARLNALLPELWVRVARSTDQSLRFAPTVDDPKNYSEAGAAGLLFEARVAWHFDRLMFDSDELSVEKMRAERAEGAAKLGSKVLATLFAWQKSRLRAADAGATDEARALAALEEAEAVVELDVLTDGWFSSQIRPARSKPSGRE
jgi:hypothetical protein